MSLRSYCSYLSHASVAIYLAGRFLPRKWIFEKAFPFKCFGFEKEGKLYEKLRVHQWKTKVPDASVVMHRLFPKWIPKKRIDGDFRNQIPILIKETCVAEATHFAAILSGFACIPLWNGIGGHLMAWLFALLNLPFILIQRYNRPRLLRIFHRIHYQKEKAPSLK